MSNYRKILKLIIYICFLFFSVFLILEVSYRFYIFDFYGNTFKALNTDVSLINRDQKQTILILGDSFTADPNSYVKHIRDSFPEYNVINSGIPGTSITQANLMLEKRINQTPKLLELLSSIKKDGSVTTITQNHSGTGDNIGRDKNIK